MAPITKIIGIAVLFCAWAGTSAQGPQGGSCNDLEFGFGREQEENWGDCWETCNGNQQSPIDIKTNNVTIEDLPNVTGPFYDNRNIPFYFNATNDNFTLTVFLQGGQYLFLQGGPLRGRYFLDRLQFCWGSNDSMGSDHTIDGMMYPLEAQWLLRYEDYATFEEASQNPFGIFMISQLYNIQTDDNPSLAPIVGLLDRVIKPGQTTTSDEPLTYDQIFSGLPVDDYYHYNGSFTTPPCTENITWFVYPACNGVAESQLEAFRMLQSTDGPLVNNFRYEQPLNGRRVVRSNKGSSSLGNCGTRAKPAGRVSGGLRQGTKSSRRGASRQHAASRQNAASRQHGASRQKAASRQHAAARGRHQ